VGREEGKMAINYLGNWAPMGNNHTVKILHQKLCKQKRCNCDTHAGGQAAGGHNNQPVFYLCNMLKEGSNKQTKQQSTVRLQLTTKE